MARIVCLGEAMVELSGAEGTWSVDFGGDTLNTAVHLVRAGHNTAYMTALGTDVFSGRLRRAWAQEGLDCSLVLTHPRRQVGLYAISTDEFGERSFTYWREKSAARQIFDLPEVDAAIVQAARADLFYFSLISLAILPPERRRDLLRLAGAVRANGGLVAFDGNYRPRLWESPKAAAQMRDEAIATADIGLPTFEDEALIDGAVSPSAVSSHWQRLGCREVVVKLGSQGCLLPDGVVLPVPASLDPVDTSGAGDAFNGGYLATRMNGGVPEAAAHAGHQLAGWTVMRQGAIPHPDARIPYRSAPAARS